MNKYDIIFAVVLLLLAGCGSNKGIQGDEAFTRISPVKELEKDIPIQQPINLIVQIRNVADLSHSNKSSFELYINDRKVQPSTEVTNATNTYTYRLRLQAGYYRIKGHYLWHNGRREERTPVEMNEMLRIIDNQKAEVTTTIRKDWRGTPVTDKFFFDVTYKPLYEQQEGGSDENSLIAGSSNNTANSNKIKIQVNADPKNSLVILDDLTIGNAPISLWVDRNTSHVIQVSHPGYQSVFRYLDEEKLQSPDKLIFIEQLTPLTALNFFSQPNSDTQSKGERSNPTAGGSSGPSEASPSQTADSSPGSEGETASPDTPAAESINAQPQPPNNFQQTSQTPSSDGGRAVPEEGEVEQEQASAEGGESAAQTAQLQDGENPASPQQTGSATDQQPSSADDGPATQSGDNDQNQANNNQPADNDPSAKQSPTPESQTQSQPSQGTDTERK